MKKIIENFTTRKAIMGLILFIAQSELIIYALNKRGGELVIGGELLLIPLLYGIKFLIKEFKATAKDALR